MSTMDHLPHGAGNWQRCSVVVGGVTYSPIEWDVKRLSDDVAALRRMVERIGEKFSVDLQTASQTDSW